MKRLIKKFFFVMWVLLVLLVGSYCFVERFSKNIVQESVAQAPVALVLGAAVRTNGLPSDIFADRLLVARDLYRNGQIQKIIISGDNGRHEYNEVEPARDFLIKKDVPRSDIYLDYAGFDTYDSLYRMKVIFGAQEAIIVTQNFHLPRALFLCWAFDVSCVGVSSDRQRYRDALRMKLREWPARFKAIIEVILHIKPTYLGDPVSLDVPQPDVEKK